MVKKILWVSEFSELNTGYSVYTKEVLNRLLESGKYEIRELACYCMPNDHRLGRVRWKVYPNMPMPDDEQRKQLYESSPNNQFGAFRFEEVCLDYQPDIVCSITDFWMAAFIDNSPYRDLFKHIWMVACDASPQAVEWLDVYGRTDAIFTYSDWAVDILDQLTGNNFNVVYSTSPSAADEFQPLPDKRMVQAKLGLGEDIKIVGMVCRNQRRKRLPTLFKAFRRYLNETGSTNTYLYLHTSYPELNGWELPQLIMDHDLCSRVLCTYVCEKCGMVDFCFFADAVKFCHNCHQPAVKPANVQFGVSNEVLSAVYNMFDLYVQCANSEGFGMPVVEAAACGVPLAVVNYSAMCDFVEKLGAYPIPYVPDKEMETGCDRAVPDCDALVDILHNFFSLPEALRKKKAFDVRQAFEKHYSWDATAQKWADVIDNFNDLDDQRWHQPPRFHQPQDFVQETQRLTNKQFVDWLILEVLGEPGRLNSAMSKRMLKELNYGKTTGGLFGLYYNEDSSLFSRLQPHPFNREEAYKRMRELCDRRNHHEQLRARICT